MALAFLLAATACAYGTWRAEARDTRLFLAGCLALNLVALVVVAAMWGEAAWVLADNPLD